LTHTVSSQGTVAWPVGAVPAFSGTSMSNHSHTVTAKGSNDAPAFTGTALGTHTHTITGSTDTASAGTPAGSISAPNFTGTAASPEPTYYKLAYIMRL
jgi:hypothetical protein